MPSDANLTINRFRNFAGMATSTVLQLLYVSSVAMLILLNRNAMNSLFLQTRLPTVGYAQFDSTCMLI